MKKEDFYNTNKDSKTAAGSVWANLAKGFSETLKPDNDSGTWEQFFAGALQGALGMPVFGRANTEQNAWLGKGNLIGIAGGIKGEYERPEQHPDTKNEHNPEQFFLLHNLFFMFLVYSSFLRSKR